MKHAGDGCRMWFWFRGVEADRPGGPWWQRNFYATTSPPYKSAAAQRQEMYNVLRPFIHAIAIDDEGKLEREPPASATAMLECLCDEPPDLFVCCDTCTGQGTRKQVHR